MAVGDLIAKAGKKPADAPAGAPAPAGASPVAKKSTGVSKKQELRAAFDNEGKAIIAAMTDEEKKNLGCKSDTIEFVSALGDPSKQNKRETKQGPVKSHVVVGFALKFLEDATVPYAPFNMNYESLMDCKVSEDRPVKKGETVYLNLYEVAKLLSRPEYSAKISGGGASYILSCTFTEARKNEPLPILRKVGEGSVKANMVLIADPEVVDGKKQYKLKEGFDPEKWGALVAKKTTTTAAKKGSTNDQAAVAAAFSMFFKNREGK